MLHRASQGISRCPGGRGGDVETYTARAGPDSRKRVQLATGVQQVGMLLHHLTAHLHLGVLWQIDNIRVQAQQKFVACFS